MITFGLTFKFQKRKDDGYIIIMDLFFSNLLDNFYQPGDHDDAFDIFKNTLKEFDLNLDNLKNDENWM
jgi:hypothetical protein